MKRIKLDVYNDPGHGWVKVPAALLFELGIAEQITRYSYMLNEFAYLEEDQDASTLFTALKAAGYEIEQRSHYAKNESKIRHSYQPYDVTALRSRVAHGPLKSGDCVEYGSVRYRLVRPLDRKGWQATRVSDGALFRLKPTQVGAALVISEV